MRVMICRALNERGEPLWKERFPSEMLIRYKEEAGSLIFGLQFQNDVTLCQGSFVKEDCLRYYEEAPSGLVVRIGVDPAISLSEKADFFAVVVVGERKKRFYVLRTYQAHLTFREQVNLLQRYFNDYEPVTIAVEATAYQRVLAEVLKECGLPVQEIQQRQPKELRIMRLAALFESSRIYMKREQNELISQLLAYPHARNDDLLDALSLAISSMMRRATGYYSLSGF